VYVWEGGLWEKYGMIRMVTEISMERRFCDLNQQTIIFVVAERNDFSVSMCALLFFRA
jgi:hypothetical protein